MVGSVLGSYSNKIDIRRQDHLLPTDAITSGSAERGVDLEARPLGAVATPYHRNTRYG